MTNYESTSYHVEDDRERSLAFSTIDRPGEEHVLRAWSTQVLADNQLTELEVLFTEDDARQLQAWLNDRFGRAKSGGKSAATQRDEDNAAYFRSGWVSALREVLAADGNWDARHAVQWAREQLAHLDENLPAVPLGNEWKSTTLDQVAAYAEQDASWQPAQVTETGAVIPAHVRQDGHTARQCPVIYSGVQCAYPEHGPETLHSFQGGLTAALTPISDGAATPPATGQPAIAPAGATAEQGVAAASATAAGTAEAAPSDAKPKRKRRTKLEIAYDAALEAYTANANESTYNTLAEARSALAAKDPNNERVSGQGQGPAPETPAEIRQELAPAQASVRFAEEPVNPFTQPAPIQPGSPQDAAGWQGQTPDGAAIFNPMAAAAQVSPQETQAAQAFPCPVNSTDGRQCQRPYGHEIATATNPEPKPHIYATNPATLPNAGFDPQLHAAEEQFEQAHPSVAQPGFSVTSPTPAGMTPGGGAQVLSFLTPPTPAEMQPAPQDANLQPPAPAAPFLQPTPNGGQ